MSPLVPSIASGQRFIAVVDNGHAVVVDGVQTVNGLQYAIVRDPVVGAYLERLDWFLDQRVVQDTSVGSQAIWGVTK